jgi:hypothetical protein
VKPWDSPRGRVILCVILVAGTIGIGWPLFRANARLRAQYGYAFPDLQDAVSAAKASEIVAKWDGIAGANDAIRKTMQADLVFPFFYASLGALLAYWVSLRRKRPWVARLGRWAAIAALAGGAADLVENGIMLQMLGDAGAAASLYPVMHAFTWIKGGGLAVAWVYIVFAHIDW